MLGRTDFVVWLVEIGMGGIGWLAQMSSLFVGNAFFFLADIDLLEWIID